MYRSIKRGHLPDIDASLIFEGVVQVIYDDPEKGLGKSEDEVVYLKALVEPIVKNVENTFEIISPYFVPGADGVEFLTDMVKKGIKVRVVTSPLSSTDGLMAQSGCSRRRYDLLEGEVELYELKTNLNRNASKSLSRGENAKSGLHAKTYIFDRQQVFIGSFNFDKRSANINSEVGVVYDVPDMVNGIAMAVFDEALKSDTYTVKLADRYLGFGDVEIYKDGIYWVESVSGQNIYHTTEPDTGFWRRFGQGFFSILPIESQL